MKKKDIYRDLGEYFREKRLRAGLSQSEVGDALGYSSSQFISNFERGVCAPPLNKMKILMELYKISMTEMSKILIENQKKLIESALSVRSKSFKARKSA